MIKKFGSILSQNQMSDCILDRLKEFRQLQNDIRLDELQYLKEIIETKSIPGNIYGNSGIVHCAKIN